MRRVIFLTVVFLCVSLLIPKVYSQTINDWERKVYYEATDRVYNLPQGYSNEQYNGTLRETAYDYGLGYAEMKDIVDRVWDQDLTDKEWDIADEIWDKYDALPKGASEYQTNQVYQEVANKYGLAVNVVYDIDERAWWGF